VTPLADVGLDPCVHCGFCLQSCPTYRATDDEADSPRGRIVLMQALAEGHLRERDIDLQRHIDRCLGCRACEPACPSGVEYGQALEATRAILHEHRALPLVARLLHGVIAQPGVRRILFGAARAVRPLSARAAGPSRAGIAWGMLAATRPTAPGLASASSHPSRGGCIMDDLFSHVHAATERVLQANGCTVLEIPGQACCGALHVHAGQRDGALALARTNLTAFDAMPVDGAIAVNAAGCGAMLKEYNRLFAGEPETDAATALAARSRDITEILADVGPRPGAPLELRVAYDPPCHLVHAQRVAAPPERILGAIPGLTRVTHVDAEQCCGSAGSYTFSQPGLAMAVLRRKVEALAEAAPDVIVTGNPGCIMQIGAGVRAAGLDIPVVHPVELLDWSYERAGYYRG
jgi:glycolate oxidase iron-sulfur subunit